MYHVTVFMIDGDGPPEAIDFREFKFGTWPEIGYWLDYKFYNGSAYKVEIKFID